MMTCEQIANWVWSLAFLMIALISGSIAYYWAKGRYTSKIVKYELLNKCFLILLRLTIATSVVYIVIVILLYFMHHSIPTLGNLGVMGDFVGGVLGTLVACMGAIYIIKTYKKQLEQSRLQTFEQTCAAMLDLHRQNVQEIELKISVTESYRGRSAFPQLVAELSEIYEQTEEAIRTVVASDVEKYAHWADANQQQTLAHKLAYGYFFYDIKHYNIVSIENRIEEELCQAVSSHVEASIDDKYKRLQRHINLGHYYRHLYNMIKYIDEVELIKSKHKDNYIQIIRALLSDYEQVLLYYNSMSELGKTWNKPIEKEGVKGMCLMAKYRLLKNCPNVITFFGISPFQTYAAEIETYTKNRERFFDYLRKE